MILFVLLKMGTLSITVITATRTFDRLQPGKVKYLLSQLCLDVEYWSSSAPELNPQHPVLLTRALWIKLICQPPSYLNDLSHIRNLPF